MSVFQVLTFKEQFISDERLPLPYLTLLSIGSLSSLLLSFAKPAFQIHNRVS